MFYLNEQNFVEPPTVFSTPQLPVSKNSIPQQEDVGNYPYLKGIQLPKIDAPIGLLIGNDILKALEPNQVTASNDKGPYAVKTIFGWTLMVLLTEREILITHQSRRGTQPTAHKVLQSIIQRFSIRQGCRAVQRRLACNWHHGAVCKT